MILLVHSTDWRCNFSDRVYIEVRGDTTINEIVQYIRRRLNGINRDVSYDRVNPKVKYGARDVRYNQTINQIGIPNRGSLDLLIGYPE